MSLFLLNNFSKFCSGNYLLYSDGKTGFLCLFCRLFLAAAAAICNIGRRVIYIELAKKVCIHVAHWFIYLRIGNHVVQNLD